MNFLLHVWSGPSESIASLIDSCNHFLGKDEAIRPENLNTVENRLDELQTSSPEDPSFPRLDSLTYLLAKRQTIHILEASGHKAL